MNINKDLMTLIDEVQDEILMNGMIIVWGEQEEVIEENVFSNGKLVTLIDYMKILVNNDIKTFMNMEMNLHLDDDLILPVKINDFLKMGIQMYGLKYDGTISYKLFRMFQKRLCEIFGTDKNSFEYIDSEDNVPNTDEDLEVAYESFNELNKLYIDLCKMVDNGYYEPSAIYTFGDDDERLNDSYFIVNAEDEVPLKGLKAICLNEMQMELFKEKIYDLYDDIEEEFEESVELEKIKKLF